ncbi:MAG: hypothetical protein ACK5JN_13435 [Kluyvera sp.]|uniref:hypothetical protein n=1 Tax=Kluyvera sp. TaxID=1538228 RepID=UPI003A8ACC5E
MADIIPVLETLSINFLSSNASQAIIYANGRNQLPVAITVNFKNESDWTDIDYTDSELQKMISIVQYRTGGTLSNLSFSYTKGDYVGAVQFTRLSDDESLSEDEAFQKEYDKYKSSLTEDSIIPRSKTIVGYISCSKVTSSELVAVQVKIGNKTYNSTENGTSSINGSGGTWKNPSYINLRGIQPVDYSNRANYNVISYLNNRDDFKRTVGDMHILKNGKGNNFNGNAEKIDVALVISLALPDHHIQKKTYNNRKGSYTQSHFKVYANYADGSSNNSIDYVMGHNAKSYFQSTIYGVDASLLGVNPNSRFYSKYTNEYCLLVGPADYRFTYVYACRPALDSKKIIISALNFETTVTQVTQWAWSNSTSFTSVSFYDNFGNTGKFEFEIKNWPAIEVKAS